MTTTIDAPTPPALIQCRTCGRPLRNATSRALRLGSHCRSELTERQLLAVLAGVAA